MTREELIRINAERLEKIDIDMRPRVELVLRWMYEQGQPAVIHPHVWRSPELQLEKFKAGYSKVQWGFHCATREGKPASLAADIIHADDGYMDRHEKYKRGTADELFWLHVGHAARKFGLRWGGYWGLSKDKIDILTSRVMSLDVTGLDHATDFGWDVAHVETNKLTWVEAFDLHNRSMM